MRRIVDDLVSLVNGAVNDRGIKLIEKETPIVLLGGLGKNPNFGWIYNISMGKI